MWLSGVGVDSMGWGGYKPTPVVNHRSLWNTTTIDNSMCGGKYTTNAVMNKHHKYGTTDCMFVLMWLKGTIHYFPGSATLVEIKFISPGVAIIGTIRTVVRAHSQGFMF